MWHPFKRIQSSHDTAPPHLAGVVLANWPTVDQLDDEGKLKPALIQELPDRIRPVAAEGQSPP